MMRVCVFQSSLKGSSPGWLNWWSYIVWPMVYLALFSAVFPCTMIKLIKPQRSLGVTRYEVLGKIIWGVYPGSKPDCFGHTRVCTLIPPEY